MVRSVQEMIWITFKVSKHFHLVPQWRHFKRSKVARCDWLWFGIEMGMQA